jgi:hypothetical protein
VLLCPHASCKCTSLMIFALCWKPPRREVGRWAGPFQTWSSHETPDSWVCVAELSQTEVFRGAPEVWQQHKDLESPNDHVKMHREVQRLPGMEVGCSSAVERLPSMHRCAALVLTRNTAQNKPQYRHTQPFCLALQLGDSYPWLCSPFSGSNTVNDKSVPLIGL